MQTAIIAALAGIIGGVLGTYIKHYLDKRFLYHRLETEYSYEERKKLRGLVGLYHGRVLLAAEHLNHRLWNLKNNESKGWLGVGGKYTQLGNHYYFITTVYRFLCFLGLVYHFQKEALYIDSRIADRNELSFLKFAKSFEWVMTDVALFNGIQYDSFQQQDHFFVHYLRRVCDSCYSGDVIASLDELQCNIDNNTQENRGVIFDFLSFFDGLCMSEKRLRWDRIVALHLLLMTFINKFGYDMQKSTIDQFTEIALTAQNKEVLQNLMDWLPKLGLLDDHDTEFMTRAIYKVTESF